MCVSCLKNQSGGGVVYSRRVATPPEDCAYTIQLLEIWRTKLLCAKEQGVWVDIEETPARMNKYLGIVGSAINSTGNPCIFEDDLDKIQDVIFKIIATEKCQS